MKKKNKASTQLTTILHNKKAKELVTIICDDKDKYLIKDKTEAILNKNVSIKCIPISNTSEDEKELTLLKNKKKKQRKEDKKEVQNNENLKTDEIILKTGKLYTETFNDHDKDLNKERTRDSNSNKDEWTRKIPIANTSEGDSLFKKKKKKTNGDKKMVQNDEDSTNDKATLKVDKFHDETLHDDYQHLNKDKSSNSNLNKNERARMISIVNSSEGDYLFKKKTKKKKGDKQMVQNYEDTKNGKATLKVQKFFNETLDENDKHLNKNKTRDSNLNNDEWTKRIPIANTLEGDSLFKKKKKKKKGDKKMVHNDEGSINNKAALNADNFYDEKPHGNYQHLNKEETRDSNLNKGEWTRKIPIANTSEGDSLFKKKKKKKKGDKQMVQNDEDSTRSKASMNVEKFYDESFHSNYQQLNKDKTRDSNLNKDEWTRRNPIFDASENGSLVKKKKKKKKGDKQMVLNNEDSKNDKITLKVEKFYNDTLDDNDKHLNKDESRNSHLNKDECTRRIPVANALDGDSLLKSPSKNTKKKKKKSKMAIKEDTELSKYELIQKCFKNMEYLNKNVSEEQSNEIHYGSTMINTPYNSRISKVPIQYPELFQKLSEKKKKDKKTSIKVVNSKEVMSPTKSNKRKRQTSDKEYSKNDTTHSVETTDVSNNYIGVDNGNKLEIFDSLDDHTSEYRPMTDTDSTMIDTSLNSRVSKVHEEHPELFHKLLKKKKKEQKKAIKAVTRKEIISPKKSNKRKQQSIDKEYSKNFLSNDSLQSVDKDVETYGGNNDIDEDGAKKLEIFDSRDDDYTSDYRIITDTGMYFGQYCNQTFNSTNGVHSHENIITGTNPLQCDVCSKTFTYLSNLVRHERTHTGEKPYACNACGRSFSMQHHLVAHYRTHTGEKPYACNVCGRSFSSQNDLVRHNRTHTGEKPYACNVCGRSFSRQHNLVAHNRTHTGEKPYACNVCGQSFSKKGNLVVHYRTHTGEKPYACNVCGRSFSETGTLVVHNRIHTGERPYECGQCEKKFSTSGNCKRHKLRVHTKCF